MGGLRRFWIWVGLVSMEHHAKKFQESVNVWRKKIEIHLECPPRVVFGKSPSRISLSEVTRTGKSSYLAIQKAHRRFKDSFRIVGIRATTFTEGISPRNVVFFGEMVFTDGMHVGHFDQSDVQVRVKVLK